MFRSSSATESGPINSLVRSSLPGLGSQWDCRCQATSKNSELTVAHPRRPRGNTDSSSHRSRDLAT
ncbi:hypothetical protein C8Q80DRAFT_1127972 [Daedaleopsis nitida]|nr:hypothetical protein C8Q80DRAFT_1127972 [Daedaleopsis nitida]